MADTLPWFPFDTGAWMTDPAILGMTGEQMGAYVWLLCLQWREGSLPYEPARVSEMVPKGISDLAAAQVLGRHFPPDPDTNERRNPRLALERERATVVLKAKIEGAGKTNKMRGRKSLPRKDIDAHRDGKRYDKRVHNNISTSLNREVENNGNTQSHPPTGGLRSPQPYWLPDTETPQ